MNFIHDCLGVDAIAWGTHYERAVKHVLSEGTHEVGVRVDHEYALPSELVGLELADDDSSIVEEGDSVSFLLCLEDVSLEKGVFIVKDL